MNNNNISVFDRFKEAYEIQDLLVGKISYISKSYMIVKIFDYPCFMPFNEIELFSISNFSIYNNKEIVVKVINIDEYPNGELKVIVSHKIVAEESLQINDINNFNDIKRNKTYKGIIKSAKDIGIFVTLGKIDGFVPKSHLPTEYKDNPENFAVVGSVVDVKVIFINEEKQQIALSIPEIDPVSKREKSPFEKFRDFLQPNETVLTGRVVFLERDCATLHVNWESRVFTIYVKKENLAWEKIQQSSDAVFLGEELDVRYLKYEDNRLYFDLKWKLQYIYPSDLFDLDTDELLLSMGINENFF